MAPEILQPEETKPAAPATPKDTPPAAPHDVLPTLFGEGYGTYQVRPNNFVYSLVAHMAGLALVLWIGSWAVHNVPQVKQLTTTLIDTTLPPLPPAPKAAGGGGGGGDRDILKVSRGTPPKPSLQTITPPTVVIRNDHPKLAVEQQIMVDPRIKLPVSNQTGDLKSVLNVPSNGVGYGGGAGDSHGGGIGSGVGSGLGPGHGGNTGGGAFRVGYGVSAPKAIYAPDPEYSEEARKAKYQGTVVLWIVVGPDGRVRDAKVQRALGMGLDEKAVEAVKQWKFEPAMKDGQPVAVQVNVEVSFRLY